MSIVYSNMRVFAWTQWFNYKTWFKKKKIKHTRMGLQTIWLELLTGYVWFCLHKTHTSTYKDRHMHTLECLYKHDFIYSAAVPSFQFEFSTFTVVCVRAFPMWCCCWWFFFSWHFSFMLLLFCMTIKWHIHTHAEGNFSVCWCTA